MNGTDDLITLLQKAFDAIPAGGGSMAGIFTSEGMYLAALCTFITVAWHILSWFLDEDGGKFKTNVFYTIMQLGIAMAIITTMNGQVRDMFVTATDEASQKIYSGANNPAAIIKLTWNTVLTIATGNRLGAAKPEFCSSPVPSTSSPPPRNSPTWNQARQRAIQCKTNVEVGFIDVMKNLPVVLVTVACQILAILGAALMSLAFIGITLIVKIIFEVGLILGPLLVGLSVLPSLSFLFDGWLKYMIGAAMIKLVAWVVTVLMLKSVIPSMTELNKAAGKAGESVADVLVQNEIIMISMAILCAAGAFIMLQVPSMASGLISGDSKFTARGAGRGIIGKTTQGIAIGSGRAFSKQIDNFQKAKGGK